MFIDYIFKKKLKQARLIDLLIMDIDLNLLSLENGAIDVINFAFFIQTLHNALKFAFNLFAFAFDF